MKTERYNCETKRHEELFLVATDYRETLQIVNLWFAILLLN